MNQTNQNFCKNHSRRRALKRRAMKVCGNPPPNAPKRMRAADIRQGLAFGVITDRAANKMLGYQVRSSLKGRSGWGWSNSIPGCGLREVARRLRQMRRKEYKAGRAQGRKDKALKDEGVEQDFAYKSNDYVSGYWEGYRS